MSYTYKLKCTKLTPVTALQLAEVGIDLMGQLGATEDHFWICVEGVNNPESIRNLTLPPTIEIYAKETATPTASNARHRRIFKDLMEHYIYREDGPNKTTIHKGTLYELFRAAYDDLYRELYPECGTDLTITDPDRINKHMESLGLFYRIERDPRDTNFPYTVKHVQYLEIDPVNKVPGTPPTWQHGIITEFLKSYSGKPIKLKDVPDGSAKAIVGTRAITEFQQRFTDFWASLFGRKKDADTLMPIDIIDSRIQMWDVDYRVYYDEEACPEVATKVVVILNKPQMGKESVSNE